jgi:hypothetical protein
MYIDKSTIYFSNGKQFKDKQDNGQYTNDVIRCRKDKQDNGQENMNEKIYII